MGFPLLGIYSAVSEFLHSVTSEPAPRWNFPYSASIAWYRNLLHSAASEPAPRWDFPHSISIERCWNPSHSTVSEPKLDYGSFSIILRELKPSVVRFFPLEISHSAVGISPLRSLVDFAYRIFPTWSRKAYGLPSSEPMGRWIHTYHTCSVVRFSPLGKQLLWWKIPAWEDNSVVGLVLILEIPDRRPGGGLYTE